MRPIRSKRSRPRLAACLPALLVALAAAPASAVRVEQVRVGDHAEFTRIVLELDGPAPYTWTQRPTGAGGELLVEIQAQSGVRVVGSRSRLVESVELKPEAAGSVARVQLRSANVTVKEMVLKAPHRIVLDVAAAPASVTAPKAAAPASVTAPKAPTSNLTELPPPTPAPTRVASATAAAKPPSPTATKPPAPTTAKPPAPPATKPPAPTTAKPSAPAATKPPTAKPSAPAATKPPTAKPSAPAATKPPSLVAEAPKLPAPAPEAKAVPERRVVERGAAPLADATAPKPGGSAIPAPGASEPAPEPLAATGLAAASEPAASPEPAPEPAASPATKRDTEAAARAARPPAEPPAPQASPSLAERLRAGDPIVGLSFALGGVLILLLALIALRRRSARIAREAAAAPWPPPGAEERPEFATAREESPEEAWEQRGDAGPLFAATPGEPGRAGDDAAPPVAIPEVPIHVEPDVVAKEADSSRVEDLERRLERLEARLADNLDARDRLERQLAAHTEELRVQRAAIARTQRAVRAAVRGPEGAAQPAPDPQSAGPQPGEG